MLGSSRSTATAPSHAARPSNTRQPAQMRPLSPTTCSERAGLPSRSILSGSPDLWYVRSCIGGGSSSRGSRSRHAAAPDGTAGPTTRSVSETESRLAEASRFGCDSETRRLGSPAKCAVGRSPRSLDTRRTSMCAVRRAGTGRDSSAGPADVSPARSRHGRSPRAAP